MSERSIRAIVISVLCAATLMGGPTSASATWTTGATENPSSEENALLEVSCWSASECVTVGEYRLASVPEPLIERLSGGKWKAEAAASLPNRSHGGNFNGVSCPSKEFCMASGVYLNASSEDRAFADEYTSGKWKEVGLSLPASRGSQLDRVSCPTKELCMMVGVDEEVAGERLTFAEKWTSASGASLERPPGSAEAVLVGVSCVTNEECMAVGWSNSTVLSDQWSGGTWTRTTSASSSLSPVRLYGVDCLSEVVVECTGVGWGTGSSKELTMSEGWTETGGWVAASTKNPSTTKDILAAVGCWKEHKCIGVGEDNETPSETALIEKLEGSSSTVETPASLPGAASSRLLGVSCQKEHPECMAVGYLVNKTSGHRETLAEHN